MRRTDLELSLGAVPTNWGEYELRRFYAEAVRRPAVRRLYVGEIACTRRNVLTPDLLAEVRDLAREAGREIVLTTPPVLVTQDELERVAALAEVVDAVEANNVGVVALWRARFSDKTLVLGPYLDVYNGRAARFFRDLGASRVVAPIDIELPTVSQLAEVFPEATEMILFGRPALAFSWRCYTSRASHALGRDCVFNCYVRREVELEGLDGERLLCANGKAIYPRRVYCSLGAVAEALSRGVSSLRIEPAHIGADHALSMVDKIIGTIETDTQPADSWRIDVDYMSAEKKRERGRVGVEQ